MKPLSDAQVTYIAERLQQVELRDATLREELLDHICCAVEEKMAAGQSFSHAVTETFDAFPDTEMHNIQREITSIHYSNHHLAMKILLFSLLSLLLVNGWYSNFHEFEEPASSTPKLLDTRTLESWSTKLVVDPPTIAPITGNFRISSGFGMRIHPIHKTKRMHQGLDLIAPTGTPVQATANGTVHKVKVSKGGYGKHIIIQHDEEYQTLYAQLSSITVQEGQVVKEGDIIGAVGSSGASTGPHLHYEVIKNGMHEDPREYFPL